MSDGLKVIAEVRIGVTGHRELKNTGQIREKVREVLEGVHEVLKGWRNTPHRFVVLSPLAEGADQLVAGEVMGWKAGDNCGLCKETALEVALPYPEEEYLKRSSFSSEEGRQEYRRLRGMTRREPVVLSPEYRKGVYGPLGHYVVDNCDVLIAIWNGKEAAGAGGTAEIVEYARKRGRCCFWIHPETAELKEEGPARQALEGFRYLEIFNTEHLDKEYEGEIKRRYEGFFKKARKAGLKEADAGKFLKPLEEYLLPHFLKAALLARRYQSRHNSACFAIYSLAAGAVGTVTVQSLFFPYFIQALWLEVAEIGIILLLFGVSYWLDWHRKWMDYRFLAERLRAAKFLHLAGLEGRLGEPLPVQALAYEPGGWIVKALNSVWDNRPGNRMDVGLEPLRGFLLPAWIEHQRDFYARSAKVHDRNLKRLDVCGYALFGVTLVVAAVHASGPGRSSSYVHVGLLHNFLASTAIVLPAICASLAAIGIHREYHRNSERYGNMERYLSDIVKDIEAAGNMEKFTEILEKANNLMLLEHMDWRVVIRFDKIKLHY